MELNELRKFVFDNKECIENFFGIKREEHIDDDENHDDDLNNSRDINDFHSGGKNGYDEMANLLRD